MEESPPMLPYSANFFSLFRFPTISSNPFQNLLIEVWKQMLSGFN